MTKVTFEKDGFYLEQNLKGKDHKTYVSFDYVTNKKGYYKTNDHSKIFLIIIFILIFITDLFIRGFGISSSIVLAAVSYFFYEYIKSFSTYETLALKVGKEIYFPKKDCHYIDTILEKRNVYLYNRYYPFLNEYDEKDRIQTINFLVSEEVITKDQILKEFDVKFDEETNEFICE